MTTKIYKRIFVTAASVFVIAMIAFGNPAAAQGGLNVGQSTTGGQILNPYPGEQIVDRQPMIGVKLPEALSTLSTATQTVAIYFYLDGNDVSSEAQISIDYIFYVPPIPMKLGIHNILIRYKLRDITNGTETDIPGLQPISWAFTVVAKLETAPQPSYGTTQKPSISGRLYINMADVNLNAGIRAANPTFTENDIKYHESFQNTGSFDFIDRFYGKTLTGHYERNIEEITGRANDYFTFHYLAMNNDIYGGDFPVTSGEFSELTINGVRVRGIKAVQPLNSKYVLTTLGGRSQEAQNGQYYRRTFGYKLDTSASKNFRIRFTQLDSIEKNRGGIVGSLFLVPKHDTVTSCQSQFTYNKLLSAYSEFVFDHHAEGGTAAANVLHKDFAYKNYVTYRSKRIETQAGRRTTGPSFNPTTQGAFTESDREGSYGSFGYTPSAKFQARTFFDAYHNNVRHTLANNLTDKSTNSISSLNLRYPHLPMVMARYSKLYGKSDADRNLLTTLRYLDPPRSESTTANLVLLKPFNDIYMFNSNNITAVFSRFDNDRTSYAGGATYDFRLRSDSTSYTATTRWKDFALLSYNTSLNKTFSAFTAAGIPSSNDSKTTSNALNMQLNIIPFKFITNLNYRRTAQTNITTYTPPNIATVQTYLSAAPKEVQQIATFIYYLTNKKKLTLEYENFDKEFRANTSSEIGRGYDERVIRLGYTLDF